MDKFQEEPYHGWTIQIFQEPLGYTFQCQILEKMMNVTNTHHYVTAGEALRAGRLRADLESVRLSLTTFLGGKFRLLLLNSQERSALECSIDQYINIAQHQFH